MHTIFKRTVALCISALFHNNEGAFFEEEKSSPEVKHFNIY